MEMTRFTCVVLAGGPRDAVALRDPNAPNKAFISVAGRTLVTRTIDALRSSPRIGRIIIVAPESTHTSPTLANADERRTDGPRITDSLRSGLRDLPPDELIIIAASDLPILTRAAVNEFITQAEETGADIIYACVEQGAHLARFPEIPHTWAHVREGVYCGAGLTALRPRVFTSLERFLERLGAARKNPLALASIFGPRILALYALRKLGITEAEARAAYLLGASVRAVVCSHPEIAVNIDRVHDVALAENLLYSRCQHETAQ
jgi:molybdopterin-guanine dinucleotide biosynthesis protein A